MLQVPDRQAIVSVADAGGVITYVNEKFTEVCGYSPEELIGQTHNLVNSGEHTDEFFQKMWQTIASGEVWTGNVRNRRKDGSLFWVRSTIVPVLGEDGQPEKYVATQSIVTELKRTELDRQLSLSFDHMVDRVFVFWPDTLELVLMNQSALSRFSLTLDDIADLKITDLDDHLGKYRDIFSEENLRHALEPLLSGHSLRSTVFEATSFDGDIIEVHYELVEPEGERARIVAVLRDVTGQNKDDGEPVRFESIIKSFHGEVFMFWQDTLKFFYVNDEAVANNGVSRDAIVGMTPLDLLPELGEASFRDLISPLIEGEKKSIVIEMVSPRRVLGKTALLEFYVQIFDRGGARPYFVAIVRDATRQRKLEEELLQLKVSLDLGDSEIYIFWPETFEFIYLNRVALDATGWDEGTFRQRRITDFLSDSALAHFHKTTGTLLKGEKKVETWEIYSRRRKAYIEITLQLIQPPGQKPRFFAVYRNISKRKEAEKQVQQLKSALDLMQDEIYLYRPEDLNFLYVNQSGMRRFGWSEHDYRSKTVANLTTDFDEARFRRGIEPLIAGDIESFDLEVIDERNRPIVISQQYVRLDGGGRIIAVARDISERKEIERRKSEFVSTVSHELRTPLTSIKGALALVDSGAVGEVSDKVSDVLGIARKNSDRLAQLINDILDFQKIDAGKQSFSFEAFDAASFIREAVEQNRMFGEKFGVRYVPIDAEDPIMVVGDRCRLMQVMDNLLSNAAKFSESKKSVDVSVARNGDKVRISVKDYGIGVPEEAREKIFDRFTQIDSTDSRKYDGTGLGLSIAKTIVEKHGSMLRLTSEVGKGTTFYFDLRKAP